MCTFRLLGLHQDFQKSYFSPGKSEDVAETSLPHGAVGSADSTPLLGKLFASQRLSDLPHEQENMPNQRELEKATSHHQWYQGKDLSWHTCCWAHQSHLPCLRGWGGVHVSFFLAFPGKDSCRTAGSRPEWDKRSTLSSAKFKGVPPNSAIKINHILLQYFFWKKKQKKKSNNEQNLKFLNKAEPDCTRMTHHFPTPDPSLLGPVFT